MTLAFLPHVTSDAVATVWLWLGGLVTAALAAAYIAVWLAHRVLRKRSPGKPPFRTIARLAPPLCLLSGTLVLRFALPSMGLVAADALLWTNILAIIAASWGAIAVTNGVRHWLHGQFDINQSDNLRARGIHTQLGFIEKVIDLGIVVAGIIASAYQLTWGRTLGNSLLASAGVASLVIGFAAQKTIGNLIAGFQIAFTQPIRIGDAVVAEEEWGWIEEITLTYVVIRIWDMRRLVLPITYFVETPFQNWTRTSGQILGSVYLTVSHFAPFDAIEQRFGELLDKSTTWDRDARALQVTDSGERTVVLRALMTAKDSPTCWDLRCEIRRGLLEFLAAEHPEALPALRLADAAATSTGGDWHARPGQRPGPEPTSARPPQGKRPLSKG